MKIQQVEITNYKAFAGTHKIRVGGKNLFIYGENGSGKSSLYYALKDFFQSSIEDIDLAELENIFVSDAKKGRTSIKVTFRPNHQGQNRQNAYSFNAAGNDARRAEDTSIRDGNKLKSFLTYKHLLGIHHLKKDEAINLFDLLVKGVLKHFKYSLSGDNELGELWTAVETSIAKPTGKSFPTNRKRTEVKAAIKAFNEAFGELFKPDSPEYILKHARPILQQFNHNIEIELAFPQLRPNADFSGIEGAEVQAHFTYAGQPVPKPHLFLNEARLSAIAISIYLGMIKRHLQGIPCKILFLDDVFIGLDIANRLPLLKILATEFPDYQILVTTYDKPWFEYARDRISSAWKTMEFYAKDCPDGTQIPLIVDDQGFIAKARSHLQNGDYKAAAVYARSAYEKEIQKACKKREKAVPYKARIQDYTSDDFWQVLKDDLTEATRENIETYRSRVLNTFTHFNTERNEIRRELENAIQSVVALKEELDSYTDQVQHRVADKSRSAYTMTANITGTDIESIYACRTLPAFDPRDLDQTMQAINGCTALPFRQAWLPKEEEGLAPATIQMGWQDHAWMALATLQDRDIRTEARQGNDPMWALGDALEIFLRPGNDAGYWEFHVAPNNMRLRLRFTHQQAIYEHKAIVGEDAEPRITAGPFLIEDDFESTVWQPVGEDRWIVLAVIPFHLLGRESPAPGERWRFSISRYDHDRARKEPHLSSTSPHRRPDFHDQSDWGNLQFLA